MALLDETEGEAERREDKENDLRLDRPEAHRCNEAGREQRGEEESGCQTRDGSPTVEGLKNNKMRLCV